MKEHEIISGLKKEIGWDILDDTLSISIEKTVDPLIKNVTVTFKVIKHEP